MYICKIRSRLLHITTGWAATTNEVLLNQFKTFGLRRNRTMKRFTLIILCALAASLLFSTRSTVAQETGPLGRVRAIPSRVEWNRFKILVWQYKTSVLSDIFLYRHVGLGGFHIDRGHGKDDLVKFSLKERFPYYVDHAAGKGILYLKKNNLPPVIGKRDLAVRPYSLSNQETIEILKGYLSRNISATKDGCVLAYAFDDEISLGHFTTPCDVDVHPSSLKWFREWLQQRYEGIHELNSHWGTDFNSFDTVMPQGFEEIRKRISNRRVSGWNLSPWMDFRHFMDFQFASVLAELTRYTNSIDPTTPAGFVGGQAPSPWGGYDYAMMSRAVQWMEAYDIHGTNEILRSFWNQERRPRMQTFFSSKNPKLDSWFLWYYMLHGNQAVIAWPEAWFRTAEHEIAPWVLDLKGTFEEVQGPTSEVIVDPNTVFDPDPIGIYYSHPSIQAGWAMDALTHGSTWTNRQGSIDNENQSKGVLRKVWCKTLEDIGFQYDFISYLDVEEGKADLSKFKVIILPKTICLSSREADALKTFVSKGGILVADYLCGLLDEHGKARQQGALDELFGVKRKDSKGYMNGKALTEIDGEKYHQPFLERFPYYNGAFRYKDIVVFERGTKHTSKAEAIEINSILGLFQGPSVLIRNSVGKGLTFYLNLSPMEYWDQERRFSKYGDEWRKIVLNILQEAGLQPTRVKVYENGNHANMIECLYWKNGDQNYLGLVKNPTMEKERSSIGKIKPMQGITGKETEIELEFTSAVGLVNLRTRKYLGTGKVFHDRFKPWEGNLYEIILSQAP
ncbi:MAG: beta-galactosidase trimerization domain-containing protein [Candidatus Hodarchaeota archaeon]